MILLVTTVDQQKHQTVTRSVMQLKDLEWPELQLKQIYRSSGALEVGEVWDKFYLGLFLLQLVAVNVECC